MQFNRGLRLAQRRSFPLTQYETWLKARDEIMETIMQKGWNEKKGSFVQHFESNSLDASVLMMVKNLIKNNLLATCSLFGRK